MSAWHVIRRLRYTGREQTNHDDETAARAAYAHAATDARYRYVWLYHGSTEVTSAAVDHHEQT